MASPTNPGRRDFRPIRDESCSSTIRGDDVKQSSELRARVPRAEPQAAEDHAPLPPKKLKRYTNYQLRRRHVEPCCVYSLLAIVAIVLVATVVPHVWRVQDAEPTKALVCPNPETSSFHINVPVLEGAPFTTAKYIDLAWDTFVGRGGSFLHGWLLFHVISRVCTMIMEHSALPYYFYLQVIFDPTSVKSLWSCIRMLFAKKPVSITIMVIGVFFAISHVLTFSIVWSAATGYEFSTATAYAITDPSTFVLLTSSELTVCWSVKDFHRLEQGMENSTAGQTIHGPPVSQAYRNWGDIGLGKEFDDYITNTSSGLFRDIYQYALAKETFFNQHNISMASDFSQLPHMSGTYSWFWDNCNKSGNETGTGYRFNDSCISNGLYSSVNGWQYTRVEEAWPVTTSNKSRLDPEYRSVEATFRMDPDLPLGRWVVPYNSTIWWNGTSVELDAPFLDIGSDCRWSNGSLGVCICFKDSVLDRDFRLNQKTCVNDTGYTWGFSFPLILLGLGLETTWLLLCGLMWFIAMSGSQLVKSHRPGTGIVRSILDISKAIDISLGPDTGAYTDGELVKELEKCNPVGYFLEHDNEATNPRIRLIPVPGGGLA
ncbi:hypothetical protein F4859DRAFT_519920 [Xylaria cf. heliscus]|nr:hypothetical protein F4859DRAFT_519920 [Xylaria cf. heliscus]